MTKKQAAILYKIVQFAKTHAGIIPTARELSPLIATSERNAGGYLERLEAGGYFNRSGRSRKRTLREDYLCTEIETAVCLLFIFKQSQQDPDGRVAKSMVHEYLLSSHPDLFSDKAGVDFILKRAIAAKHLLEVDPNGKFVRPHNRMAEELPYLQLVAGVVEKSI